jgi:RNA polymerase sigma-70 factor (ECF subfamily)
MQHRLPMQLHSPPEKQLETLYYSCFKGLLFYCMQFHISEEDSTEMINDVFVSVWEKKHYLELSEQLKPYLYRSVHNKALNFLAKRKLPLIEFEQRDVVPDHDADPLTSLETKELQSLIHQAMNTLPNKCKQVFVLSRVEGLNHQQISDIMSVSTKTIENQMTIALRKIRKALKNHGY